MPLSVLLTVQHEIIISSWDVVNIKNSRIEYTFTGLPRCNTASNFMPLKLFLAAVNEANFYQFWKANQDSENLLLKFM